MKVGWKPILVAVLALVAFDAGAAKQEEIVRAYREGIDLADIEVTLERTSCLGNCPHYLVTVFGTGLVRYEGKYLVSAQGVREGRIAEDDVLKLVNGILRVRFFDADDVYSGRDMIFRSDGKHHLGRLMTSDVSLGTLTVRLGDYKKSVLLHDNYPQELGDIPKLIDDIVDIEQWIGKYCDRPRGPYPFYGECDKK